MSSTDHHLLCDFEPRELPKPAPRFESLPTPSVPEVSLIFDRPRDGKNHEYDAQQSMDKFDSYATWKRNARLTKDTSNERVIQEAVDSRRSGRRHSQTYDSQLQDDARNQSQMQNRSDPHLVKQMGSLRNSQRIGKQVEQASQIHKLSPNAQSTMKSDSQPYGHLKFISTPPDDNGRYITCDRNKELIYGSEQWRDNNRVAEHVHSHMRPKRPDFDPNSINYNAGIANMNVPKASPNPSQNSPSRFPIEYPAPTPQSPNLNPRNPNNLNVHPANPKNTNFHPGIAFNSHYHPNMVPRLHQLPLYYNSEYNYPYPQMYAPNVHTSKNENEETIKNLLQLINTQNEQIKSLQCQVERLLKIQEATLKDRQSCNCSRRGGIIYENHEQNTNLSLQTTNNNHSSMNTSKSSRDDPTLCRKPNSTLEKNMMGSTHIKERTKNIAPDHNPLSDGRRNSANRDEQMKNKIVEQKVSIGVMTSFEFTVQNNPFNPEIEEIPLHYTENNADMERTHSRTSPDDSSKCKNVFSRVSAMPLENIIEDSESHLSSSQQPSRDFNSTRTTDEVRSSHSVNRKNPMSIATVTKNSEHSPCVMNYDNAADVQDSRTQNYFHSQQNQVPDVQQRYRHIQKSQTPQHFSNMAQIQIVEADSMQTHRYVQKKSPEGHNDCEQVSNVQNPGSNNENLRFTTPIFNESKEIRSNENDRHITNADAEYNAAYTYEDVEYVRRTSSNSGSSDQSENVNVSTQVLNPMSTLLSTYSRPNNKIVTQGTRSNRGNCIEESMVLSSGELEIDERPPPSPEPSIHVEMQEYSSEDESDKQTIEKEKQTPKVGWTFYNNVLGQVNQILQNSPITMDGNDKMMNKENIPKESENKATSDNVKIATLEQLRKLGISFMENKNMKDVQDMSNKKVKFDSSYYPRLEYRGNMTQATSTMSETDTSMQMNALALKYLSDEQLGELALQKHGAETLTHLLVSNVQGTNMSFATMRYLERYQLLPVKNIQQAEDGRKGFDNPRMEQGASPQRSPSSNRMRTTSYPSKILDISTLKQQPKLL